MIRETVDFTRDMSREEEFDDIIIHWPVEKYTRKV